jgi:hypothetical protein
LRLLGLVYLAAFLSLATQVLPLLGHDGLTPAAQFVEGIVGSTSRWHGFRELPSLFFFATSDGLLLGLAWLGVALSLAVALGLANAPLLAVLWALYTSYVHIGQVWYGYGWELLLQETGFLAIFLCPLLDPRPFPRRPPPVVVIWLFRWLAFRIMFGAGMIKLRGDACWRELTCLDYHFETQPLPNPLSPLFHALPHFVHAAGVLFNHVAEVVAPFFAFGPRRLRHVAGLLMISFQGVLILSGNLSFLNWLTIVPLIACLDDSLLRRVLPAALVRRAESAAAVSVETRAGRVIPVALAVLVGLLSIGPVKNLLSSRQAMNDKFDPLGLVNTYGAFGSVGKVRNEIIFEGTRDAVLGKDTRWVPYEFKCKPGDPDRRPCIISPLQLRLDWQIWFAAMSEPADEPWTLHMVWKLLHNDPGMLSLLGNNPFPGAPPRYIRAELYRYRYARRGEGGIWKRTLIGHWLPPLSRDDERLLSIVRAEGWRPAP